MPPPSPSDSRPSLLAQFPRAWAAVLAGGLIGSAGRVGISHYLPVSSGRFPVATLAVNLSGSLLLAAYLARRERTVTATWSLHFWGIGVFGSFTTFSAFGFEVMDLIDRGSMLAAASYVAASIGGGLVLGLLGQRFASGVR